MKTPYKPIDLPADVRANQRDDNNGLKWVFIITCIAWVVIALAIYFYA